MIFKAILVNVPGRYSRGSGSCATASSFSVDGLRGFSPFSVSSPTPPNRHDLKKRFMMHSCVGCVLGAIRVRYQKVGFGFMQGLV